MKVSFDYKDPLVISGGAEAEKQRELNCSGQERMGSCIWEHPQRRGNKDGRGVRAAGREEERGRSGKLVAGKCLVAVTAWDFFFLTFHFILE